MAGPKAGPGAIERVPKLLAFKQEVLMLCPQRQGNGDVAVAGTANNRLLAILLSAKRTQHHAGAHGEIFNVKIELLVLPSESVTSTRMLCWPVGTSASGMSIPAGCTNRATRGVISTSGDFR